MGRIKSAFMVFMLVLSMLGLAGVQDAGAASCTSWKSSAYRSGTNWVLTGTGSCSGRSGQLKVGVGSSVVYKTIPYNGTVSATAYLFQPFCQNVSYSIGTNGFSNAIGVLLC